MDASDHIDGEARDGLILQLVDWVAMQPRSYAEAMDAWRSSCPALTIWEDALAGRLIEVQPAGATAEGRVRVTAAGQALLARAG